MLNNYTRQVLSIVEEVYADHNAMVRGHWVVGGNRGRGKKQVQCPTTRC